MLDSTCIQRRDWTPVYVCSGIIGPSKACVQHILTGNKITFSASSQLRQQKGKKETTSHYWGGKQIYILTTMGVIPLIMFQMPLA